MQNFLQTSHKYFKSTTILDLRKYILTFAIVLLSVKLYMRNMKQTDSFANIEMHKKEEGEEAQETDPVHSV